MYRLALAITALGGTFIAWRLVGPAGLPPAAAALAVLAVYGVFGLMLLQPVSWRREGWVRSLARRRLVRTASYLAMAFLSILFALLVARDLIGLGVIAWDALAERVGLAPVGPLGPGVERASSAVALGLAAVMTAYGHIQVRRGPRTLRVRVPLAGLPPAFAGFRIVQLSDLHIGETVRRPEIERLVETVNALGADLVAITGDLVDGSVASLGEHAAPLGALESRHGTHFVAGNHDHYSGLAPWLRFLRELGVTVLLNEHRLIERGGASLLIAGVDDWSMTRDPVADVDESVRGAPSGVVRILLAHHPKTALVASPGGFGLVLAGHTHGGQFLPWNLVAGRVHRFSSGLYRVGELWLYVSRGTFYWGPPVRLFAPAEITVLELDPA